MAEVGRSVFEPKLPSEGLEQKPKKVLVQEVAESRVTIPYQLTHEGERLTILINPDAEYLREIDLQISETALKLRTLKSEELIINFGCRIDA